MYVHVKVQAGAKLEKIVKKTEDHFEVSVRAPAQRNLANRRVVEVMAENFGLGAGKVRIISGHHSPSKILDVDV